MLLSKLKTVGAAILALGLLPAGFLGTGLPRAGAAPKADEKAAAKLEALWADLMSNDEARAARATLMLAAKPDETLPFLRERLRPVKVDAAAIAKLVKQLDSEDFETREAASRELEYLGKFAKTILEKHHADTESAEAKRAIKVVLDKIPSDAKSPPVQPKIMGRSVSIRSGGGRT
jgi:hypothetical protein